MAIESLFHAVNVRSALKLGHARGVAMLAAVEAGVLVAEYTPAEIKRAVVGYGRAEKAQVQQMVKMLLGLSAVRLAPRRRRRAGCGDLPCPLAIARTRRANGCGAAQPGDELAALHARALTRASQAFFLPAFIRKG